MSEPVIRHEGTAYRCGITTNGIDWTPVGCRHTSPRAAVDHVPTPRSASDPVIGQRAFVPGPSEALDLWPDGRLFPDGSEVAGTGSLPVDAHPSTPMSGI